MSNEMIKGYIDAIVLSVLEREDSYGYEITKSVHLKTEGQMELKEGTLYPALKRLEVNGHIEGYWVEKDSGPRRRYYRMTTKGSGKLKEYRRSWSDQERIINHFLKGGPYAADFSVVE
ncbi:PadR family transcriptional regulator [Paenibacillus pectinilyticus]|uniref:PadR family transcriptional regulator n=1 Tax=Paenibacillus pectinilyticus TaxID=512399 RepID=A0A1C1A5Q3_9BACL|nr:helix-turn-helix transcriptional regulator [Paenibacillus pectinilyticus]OCT15821.1 PadR family transcriptional regulator [Paenibacillus pectinilyticus]